MHPYLAQLEKELDRTVNSNAALVELVALQSSAAGDPLADAGSWQDVRAYIDGVGLKDDATESVLRPLLAAAQRVNLAEPWQSILLYLSWSSLLSILYRRMRGGIPDLDMWTDVTWSFLCVLRRIDLASRTNRLGQKIYNDTDHDLRAILLGNGVTNAQYAREEALEERALVYDSRTPTVPPKLKRKPGSAATNLTSGDPNGSLDDRFGPPPTVEVREVPLESDTEDGHYVSPLDRIASPRNEVEEFIARDERQWALRNLRRLHHDGHLSRVDFLVLVGGCLNGRPLEEMATRQGVSYETAKKQRQRAVTRLEKCAPDLSPKSPNSPLFLPERLPNQGVGHES